MSRSSGLAIGLLRGPRKFLGKPKLHLNFCVIPPQLLAEDVGFGTTPVGHVPKSIGLSAIIMCFAGKLLLRALLCRLFTGNRRTGRQDYRRSR